MTIPTHVMHAGQQLYAFSGLTESPDGDMLARWDCVYCGGGDYVLSALPRPVVWEELIEAPAPLVQDTAAPVPEPGAFWMLAAALVVAGLVSKFLTPRDSDNPNTGSEHSRTDGEMTPESLRPTGPASAKAVAKHDGAIQQVAERRGVRIAAAMWRRRCG